MQSTVIRMAAFVSCLALGHPLAAAADYRAEHDFDLAPGGTLAVDADRGRLTVRGTDRDGARVVVTAEDDDFEERYELTFEARADGLTVTSRRTGSWARRWFDWSSHDVHFEIEVPFETAVALETSGGRIDVGAIRAPVDLRTSGGSIEVRDVEGEVAARTSGGSIEIADIGGGVFAKTSGGSIRGETVVGDAEVDTSGGSIRLEDMGGAVEASTSGGSITVTFAPGNAAGGRLSTSGGSVTAYVDPAVALDIDAETSGGRVNLDLPVTVEGEVSRREVQGTLNGGGPELRLRTSGGGIRLRPADS